ncbi:MAG TPA: peptidoglycan DD-metalloendopeptidase family protein [Gammaproteobacteria bacterium]|nr:peptidoglycan DD-metalloendopeptidase family protein [Gammaproteobacteria bacterium]
MRRTLLGVVIGALALAGCATQEPAPIEGKSSSAALTSRPARPPLVRAPKRPTVAPDSYRVVSGDTLYSIAFRFGLDPHALAQWNVLEDPDRILVGQELRLKPPPRERAVSAPTAQTPPTASAVPAPMTPAPAAPLTSPTPIPIAPAPTPAPAVAAAPTPDAVLGGTRTAGGLTWTWPASGKTRRAVAASGSEGLEIIGQRGQPVLAAAGGQVVYSGNGLRGYGQLIIIKHNDTFLSAYAHNDKLLVAEGARVNAGQQIAEMGDSEASEVMLHFEIRKGGKAVGPLQFLPQR